MAIKLGNKTKLTADVEKLFIEAGGTIPNQTFTEAELSQALKKTIQVLAERQSPILRKIYHQAKKDGKVPDINMDENE